MAISVTCSCGRRLRAKDAYAGRRSQCPGCGRVLTIPAPAPAPSPARPEPLPAPVEVITVPCACGKQLKAPAQFAGKKARCKGCGAILTIPVPIASAASPPPADEDDGGMYALADEPPAPPPVLVRPGRPIATTAEDEDDEGDEAPRRGRDRRRSPAALVGMAGPAEYLYLLLVLAFVPLGLTLLDRNSDDLKARIERSIQAHPKVAEDLDEESSVPELIDALAADSPDGKLDAGAHLPRRSKQHWVYGALAAAGFLGLLAALFPRRETTTTTRLLLTGAFTGTVGIILLLGVQLAAGFTQGFWIRGRGMIVAIFYLIKFIGFSYVAALNPENGFWLSLFGFTFGVGLCEELCKALPLIKHHDEKVQWDWRSYCLIGLASGIGFGISEGIMYAGSQYNGISGPEIYVVRFVSCVALHAIWSASAGVAMARAHDFIRGAEGLDAFLPWVRVLGVPMLLHGLYDTLLKREMNEYALISALASFAWLAYQVEAARLDDAAEPAVA